MLTALTRLRGDILQGALRPGSKLGMAALKERYGIGLSPLREALSQLVGEGLVLSEGQRGFRVAPFSKEDLDDLTFIRLTIEEAALRAAIAQGDEVWEANIGHAFHLLERRAAGASGDPVARDAYEDAHRVFHLALTAAAGSPRSAALQAAYYDQARRYRLLLLNTAPDPKLTIAAHRQIMQLVLARDADGAIAALREHFAVTRDVARRVANW